MQLPCFHLFELAEVDLIEEVDHRVVDIAAEEFVECLHIGNVVDVQQQFMRSLFFLTMGQINTSEHIPHVLLYQFSQEGLTERIVGSHFQLEGTIIAQHLLFCIRNEFCEVTEKLLNFLDLSGNNFAHRCNLLPGSALSLVLQTHQCLFQGLRIVIRLLAN